MSILVILLILSGVFQSQCQSKDKEECVSQKLLECSEKYKVNQKIYPLTSDDLKQHCSDIQLKDNCFRNSWNECISEPKERDILINRLNEYSSAHSKEICNFNTTYSKLFVKYGKCLNLTVMEQNKCHNRYKLMTLPKDELLNIVKYSKNNSRAENFNKFRQICCWWSEYQTCVVRTVVDRCGEHPGILINEEFFKLHTSSATSKVLTYKSCIPTDQTFRFPVCFLDSSVDPNTFGINLNDKDMGIEDNSIRKDIEETIGQTSNMPNMTDFEAQIEASTHSENNSLIKSQNIYSVVMTLFIILFIVN